MRKYLLSIAGLVLLSVIFWWQFIRVAPWTDAEIRTMQTLWIGTLQAPPLDSTNEVISDVRAQRLGHSIFFDVRFSANGAVACSTCHQPELLFTDGRPVSQGIGSSKRNAPSLIGVSFSPWQYWDGRKDSLWSQALSPLEDPAEHGGTRLQYIHLLAGDKEYRTAYQGLFGTLPDFSDGSRFPPVGGPVQDQTLSDAWQDMEAADRQAVNRVFANLGKAIAAYERLLLPGTSRFDHYVEQVLGRTPPNSTTHFTEPEQRGLRLFIGDAGCIQCHNGPLMTNNSFHNTGILSRAGTTPDPGRAKGLRIVRADPFNCMGDYSHAPDQCAELEFAGTGPELIGAMRTPSLRNLAGTQPYGHAGQLPTLGEVLDHYNQAPGAMLGHNEAKPLNLWPWQLGDLEAFLRTLAAPPATEQRWLLPPANSNQSHVAEPIRATVVP